MGCEAGWCKTSTSWAIFIVTRSLEEWPTKAKEAPSPHQVRLALLDTNPRESGKGPLFNKVFGRNTTGQLYIEFEFILHSWSAVIYIAVIYSSYIVVIYIFIGCFDWTQSFNELTKVHFNQHINYVIALLLHNYQYKDT